MAAAASSPNVIRRPHGAARARHATTTMSNGPNTRASLRARAAIPTTAPSTSQRTGVGLSDAA